MSTGTPMLERDQDGAKRPADCARCELARDHAVHDLSRHDLKPHTFVPDLHLQRGFVEATKPPPSLYTIVQSFLAALAAIDEAEGEVDERLAAQLDALPVDLGARAEALKGACTALEAEADACAAMAAPYLERAARKRAQRDRLKFYLFNAMQVMSVDKAAGPTGGARIQRNGQPARVFGVPEAELEQHLPEHLFETVRVLNSKELALILKANGGVLLSKLPPAEGEQPLVAVRLEFGKHLRFF